MSVTAFVIGDPHFKVSNAPETEEATRKLLPEIRTRNPDFIVCLGDTLDRHAIIHVDPLCQAVWFLRELSQIAPLYLLIGNHDRRNNSDFLSPYSPFAALHLWPNTIVVDRVRSATIKGYQFLFVPYVPNGRFAEALSTVPESFLESKAIFAHQEIRGVKMGSVTSTQGDVWAANYPLLITGHIHDYSEPAPNVIYTGALMQQSHGERYDKTVSLFTFTPEGHSQERIDLQLKEKITVRLPCSALPTFSPPEGKIVRLILVGTSPEIRSVINSEPVLRLKRAGIKVVSESIAPEKVELSLTEERIPFRARLQGAVSESESLKKLYLELFGDATTA